MFSALMINSNRPDSFKVFSIILRLSSGIDSLKSTNSNKEVASFAMKCVVGLFLLGY